VDSGPVLERSWAQEAGLGFIGKNTCLITPRLGSWTFLAVLLVPEEVAHITLHANSAGQAAGNERQGASGKLPACGACTRCLDVCPTGAFPAPHILDARRCISYLTIELKGPIPHELRPRLGNWIFGCDLCQEVCPYNRRFARPARLAALKGQPEMAAPRLLDLLALDETAFRQRFRGSPVLRAKRRGLLRNVCVALGNWGDPAAVPSLTDALHDREPLVRGHAAWALGRIASPAARQALRSAETTEPDGYVQAEIAAARNVQVRLPAGHALRRRALSGW
jgi:epoxyqueuosine reductase